MTAPSPFTPASPAPFRMPAEWEPHEGVWVSWPHKEASWPGRFDAGARRRSRRMVAALASVGAGAHQHRGGRDGRAAAGRRGAPAARSWPCRASASASTRSRPTTRGAATTGRSGFLTPSGRRVLLDWGFNAWGGKYEPYDDDDAVPVAHRGGVGRGGAAAGHGAGGRLHRRERARDAAHHRVVPAEPEPQPRHDARGDRGDAGAAGSARRTSSGWSGASRATTPTATSTTSPASWTRPPSSPPCPTTPRDPDYPVLRDNFDRLRAATDQDGRPLTVVPLPTPGDVRVEGERVPASYANFVIANGLVLVPTYNVENDDRALETLARRFPDRTVRGLDCLRHHLGPRRHPLPHAADAKRSRVNAWISGREAGDEGVGVFAGGGGAAEVAGADARRPGWRRRRRGCGPAMERSPM